MRSTATAVAFAIAATLAAGRPDSGKSGKSGTTCGPADFQGIWQYFSPGSGNSYTTIVTCPSYLNGDCQIADQAINLEDCGVLGTIKKADMFRDENGNCAFKPVALTTITAPEDKQCPTVVSASRDGQFLLFLFGKNQDPNLENPDYYNSDTPRHGLMINSF